MKLLKKIFKKVKKNKCNTVSAGGRDDINGKKILSDIIILLFYLEVLLIVFQIYDNNQTITKGKEAYQAIKTVYEKKTKELDKYIVPELSGDSFWQKHSAASFVFDENKYPIYTLDIVNMDKEALKDVDFIYLYQTTEYLEAKGVVKFKDGTEFLTTEFTLRSFTSYIEKTLIESKIQYSWDDSLRGKINIIPFIKPVKFYVLGFLAENIFTILLLIVFIAAMMKQGSMLMGKDKKFKVVFPDEVKGSIDDLIGMEEIKTEILQLKDMIEKKAKYREYGIEETFNIMFSGPPGTGKTKIAQFLAKELEVPMVIGTGNIETGFVGGGPLIIKTIFETASKIARASKKKTVIIFLDEAQTLFVKRGMAREKWADDAANELLAQLDGVNKIKDDVNIIFIAASNFDDSNMRIDEAMERRFKKKIFFRLPNKKEREEIFRKYLEKINSKYLYPEIDYDYIAKITHNISPAKIETIINEASLHSIKHNSLITTETIVKAFERITVGKVTRKTTEDEEETRSIVIYHELGHFFSKFQKIKEKYKTEDLFEIREKMDILKISSENIEQYNVLGYVLNTDEGNLLKTKEDIEMKIISLYGGLAAEAVFLNNGDIHGKKITLGSSNDIMQISKILKQVVVEMGMYSNYRLNSIEISEEFNKEKNEAIINRVSTEFLNESLRIVSSYKEEIEFLHTHLMDKWVLSKDEIFDLLISFYSKEK